MDSNKGNTNQAEDNNGCQLASQTQYNVGDIIGNRGIIIIGGESHHVHPTHGDDTQTLDCTKKPIPDERIKELQTTLLEVNEDAAHCVPLHPLYVNTGLSVDDVYSDIVIRDDLSHIQRTNTAASEDRYKIVNDPADFFTKDDKPVRNIYMLGRPASGKTTFCLYLLKLWCAAISVANKATLSAWHLGMSIFHFVFYVSLRHVGRSRSSIVDMICEDVFDGDDRNKDVIRHVLGNPDHRCLVIMDGLDEWVYSLEVKSSLRHKGLPNTDGISSNCTMFFASRHWKVDLIQPKFGIKDKVVEILGLNDEGCDTIIQKVLVNFFKLEESSKEYDTKFNKIKWQLRNSKFKALTEIPMFTTLSVFLGYDRDHLYESLTGFVLDRLDLLIRRSEECDMKAVQEMEANTGNTIPKLLQEKKLISRFSGLLLKLGKIAYNDLISQESHLVFSRDSLQEKLRENELMFALKIGIISQMRAPGRFHIPKVSIEFLHKSIQEALAALYIVSNESEMFPYLCEYCCTVDKVMELSNVALFMSGLDAALGGQFSQYLVHIASDDSVIIQERKSMNLMYGGQASMFFKMQCELYREIVHAQSFVSNSEPDIQIEVSDVVLRPFDDDDTIRATVNIMKSSTDTIQSFSMVVDVNTENAFQSSVRVLPLCTQLTTLELALVSNNPDSDFIRVIPSLKHLQYVKYESLLRCSDLHSQVVRSFLQLPLLKCVKLIFVELDDTALSMADTRLAKVKLHRVRMSRKGWKIFVRSLQTLSYVVRVTLRQTNIDDEIFAQICESKDLKVIKNDRWHNKLVFCNLLKS